MAPGKKITWLVVVFAVMGAVSLFLYMQGKPQSYIKPYLDGTSAKDVDKIEIEKGEGKIVLEQAGGLWQLKSPVADLADTPSIERMMEGLLGFSLGPVVSENPDRFEQFDIGEDKATRLRVFAKGKDKPVLDAWIGKTGRGYGSSYVRLAHEQVVRQAENIRSWNITRHATDFRLKKVFPFEAAMVTSFEIGDSKNTYSYVRSSDTWTHKDGSFADKAEVDALLDKILVLHSYDFGKGDEQEDDLMFSKPLYSILVEGDGRSMTLKIGGKEKREDKTPSTRFYAQAEKRAAILLINENQVGEITNLLKTPPK